ncbi:hypothetical protein [Clostridium cellulovorans]|uniref:Uncharacterized protein n=1 Tax=Clostridium cellulovorans (strain ATCC 35296 / DSM 3052 / OCM 3 / 743B) TaxID=573061 RepID=D9SQ36_CLOC7|nr:hypothetical protein [Clostridium cellulovorans]ADL52172.1 protein of unknown function DUF331 [Clostridium cellulovorans 743B]
MEKDKIVLKGGFVKAGRMFNSDEISRGTGISKAKKGKGSYDRKEKHKKSHRQLLEAM